MSANNNEDQSKINKIREDLEKKLAALERSKLSKEENVEDVNSEEIDAEKAKIENEIKETETELKDEKFSFLDQISNIENDINKTDATPEIDVTEESEEDTIFEISDEIEDINSEENETEIKEERLEEKEVEEKEEKVAPIITSQKKDVPVDKIDSNIKKDNYSPSEDYEDIEIEEEEEEKSSKMGFLMYGLIGVLALVVGYFAMDYFKGKNKLDSEKTNQKITELQNRRYQDSIKLLEAEKRLAEFESQRYIDSIAEADRLRLSVVDNNRNDNGVTDKKKAKPKTKASKPTTTIYRNNKAVVTSNSSVNFDKVVKSDKDNTVIDKEKQANEIAAALKNEKDKEIAKEIKKEKKIETLNTIEKAPIYPGCEKQKTERAKKTCMISKINKFVNKNFNSYIAQDLGLNSGLQRINVSFIIDKNGYVNVLRTRAKHEALKKEAVRVVNKLPRMKPAMSGGKKTQIVYNLPIVFSIEE